MREQFWQQRWKDRKIGFHEGTPNKLLVSHIASLAVSKDNRVFLPLCGKTQDIGYFLSLGLDVVGVEFSPIAIDELFIELGVEPTITKQAGLLIYGGPNLRIYVGDFFALNQELLGPVDAVYDRAALVALPFEMRPRYASKLVELTDSAPQLLIVFEYDQTQMNGPPFSISETEVKQHYSENGLADYACTLLEARDASSLFGKGITVSEHAWLLEPTR